jgi:hypothetical protein
MRQPTSPASIQAACSSKRERRIVYYEMESSRSSQLVRSPGSRFETIQQTSTGRDVCLKVSIRKQAFGALRNLPCAQGIERSNRPDRRKQLHPSPAGGSSRDQ